MFLKSMKKIRQAVSFRNRALQKKYSKNFNQNKKAMIDFVFRKLNLRADSFADLGGVWEVDAAYTFYTLDKYNIMSSFLVDTDFTELMKKRAREYKNLNLIKGNFGDEKISKQITKVSMIFLFDVLLHQVKPDWDEILKIYSQITDCFVIYNPQFIASEKTIRLFDLGVNGYFENVPHNRDNPTYDVLFEKMYDIHPQHKRIWRDIHNVWQWGITDHDLSAKMKELGFELKYYKNCGQWGPLKNFQNHAFVFQKANTKQIR